MKVALALLALARTTVTAEQCVCESTWNYAGYAGCDATQSGCPSTPCDSDSHSWCVVTDGTCDGASFDGEYDYAYCAGPNDATGPSDNQAPAGNTCACQASWNYPDWRDCDTMQSGCPDAACDWDDNSWCLVEDNTCDGAQQDEEGYWWGYCAGPQDVTGPNDGGSSTPASYSYSYYSYERPPDIECACLAEWTYAGYANCDPVQSGCPAVPCDGAAGDPSWCLVDPAVAPNCPNTVHDGDDYYWGYCTDANDPAQGHDDEGKSKSSSGLSTVNLALIIVGGVLLVTIVGAAIYVRNAKAKNKAGASAA